MTELTVGAQVHHARLGVGTVKAAPNEGTVVVRFDGGLQECRVEDLEVRTDVLGNLERGAWDDSAKAIARAQAEVIRSVNQMWGIFAPARIQLLPHQLWVCKRVLERWPTRWLIADDVGLGKTIEAGLVLWPLLARGAVKRLLIICPASLVEQWQLRMQKMFDLNFVVYSSELDQGRVDFWGAHRMVIASLQTLRADRDDRTKSRRQRLLDADPWDLVVIDEAHHLNVEEHGETQGYRLLREMQDAGCVVSMLMFTATPHRGKHRGFFSLLELLRPDLFSAKKDVGSQLPRLREAVIRNNKQTVTDLKGKRLFIRPTVRVENFRYSAEEQAFYDLLTRFISEGRAYAGRLGNAGQAVGLVLTALQKLAASSAAAIRSAIAKRISLLEGDTPNPITLPEIDESDLDQAAANEERAAESVPLSLVEDELPALRQLLAAATAVPRETKVDALLQLLDGALAGRTVLMFTEYIATQAMVVEVLRARYGKGSVAFINGKGVLPIQEGGRTELLREDRRAVADRFNEGTVRFLVSTEAAGEGIDLQESCFTIVHLDVPWNPMRIHQRNGRIYRYGQSEKVEVVTLRNPDNVESKIWDLLTTKMEQIQRALTEVMDDPEDLSAIVLGMTSAATFDRLFEDGSRVAPERLNAWFAAEEGKFGGKDAIEAVRDIFGNVARFDFQEIAAQVPRVGLEDLEPFMKRALLLHGRRFVTDGASGTLSVHTPDDWLGEAGLRRRYQGLTFKREAKDSSAVLSAGHRLVLASIERCASLDASAAVASGLRKPMLLVKIRDQITTGNAQLAAVVVGIELDADGRPGELLFDWQALQRLNLLAVPKQPQAAAPGPTSRELVNRAVRSVEARLGELRLPFEKPKCEALVVLWPHEGGSAVAESEPPPTP